MFHSHPYRRQSYPSGNHDSCTQSQLNLKRDMNKMYDGKHEIDDVVNYLSGNLKKKIRLAIKLNVRQQATRGILCSLS